jgi:enoyl-CoA hydratase/carnithine racemase
MSAARSYPTLACETPSAGVLLVTLNRPDAANALDTQMGRDLFDLFSGLIFDAGAVRCVALTGAGRHFCAGGDLKERDGMSDAAWRAQHVVFEQAFQALMDCPVPVIAGVNGAAYGGGCEMALACDFIYAAETARFALVETGLGIIPGGGGTQNLPRAVGARRARELLYRGTPFSAQEAADWGMVNALYPTAELRDALLGAAAEIAARAPVAIRQVKRAVNLGSTVDLKTGLAIEIEAYNRTVGTADRREGIAAAREKRPPVFTGE